jgi:hypothetical protein
MDVLWKWIARLFVRVQCPDCFGYGQKVQPMGVNPRIVKCTLCRGKGRI